MALRGIYKKSGIVDDPLCSVTSHNVVDIEEEEEEKGVEGGGV